MRMRVNGASIRSTAVNLCLVLVSCAVGLALCEVSLRLFYPRYRHLAEAQSRSDAMRIWARTPHSREWRNHPDTDVPHSFNHNNLALRQHRDFNEADLASATNIGVFGDSFTQNTNIPVQYSFTEPLDYLLNQSGKPFNVLNFGVDGYEPGQSLLHYEHFPYAEDLDHVFFVYCEMNDLSQIYQRGLFHLDEAGRLVRDEAIRESWWAPLMRRLHIPYLLLDVSGRWASFLVKTAIIKESLRVRHDQRSHQGRLAHGNLNNPLAIFRQLIRHWKHVAEQNGSTFSVVLLPSSPPQPVVVDLLTAEAVEVIDLYTCFGDADPAHLQRPWHQSPYRFRGNDMHWNETGNQLAATCLYRFLEEKVGLPRLSEERLRGALSRYYAAFEAEIPLMAGEGKAEGAGSVETAAAIRGKYLALDEQNIFMERVRKVLAAPEKRIIHSVFDIYIDGQLLLYVKAECRPTDREAPFFLHVIPVDEGNLPKRQRQGGFKRMAPFTFAQRGFRSGRHGCVIRGTLPRYPVRYLRTGQYVPDAGRLWEGTAWLEPNSGGDERQAFPVATGQRIIDADFDVYMDGRQLVYHKADCGPADREAPFFLHVIPVDKTNLPPDRGQAGFDSLDVNSCTVERQLPAYAIRHIGTGQFTDAGPLWKAEFTLDQASVSRGDERAAVSRRTVRSVFDVTLEGRRLIYRKAECRPDDLRAKFFVHVTPADIADLSPARVRHGFENLDFLHPFRFRVDEFGCRKTARLPAYAIHRIRTGQFLPGTGRLWEGEFAMAQAAVEQD